MSGGAARIPGFVNEPLGIGRVVVRLHVVRREVTRLSQVGGKTLHLGRDGIGGTHLVRSQARSPHSCNQCRSRRRTHRSCRKGVGIPNGLLRKRIEIWSRRKFIPIRPESRAHVLCGDPENVGTILHRRFGRSARKLAGLEIAEPNHPPLSVMLNPETSFA